MTPENVTFPWIVSVLDVDTEFACVGVIVEKNQILVPQSCTRDRYEDGCKNACNLVDSLSENEYPRFQE